MSLLLKQPYLENFAIPKWLARQVILSAKDLELDCLVIEDKKNTNHKCLTNAKQKELLLNMLKAIGIKYNFFKCISIYSEDFNEQLTSGTKTVLLLTDTISYIADNAFYCPHPYEIIKDSNLKVQAWSILKKLQKKLHDTQ